MKKNYYLLPLITSLWLKTLIKTLQLTLKTERLPGHMEGL